MKATEGRYIGVGRDKSAPTEVAAILLISIIISAGFRCQIAFYVRQFTCAS